MGGQRLRLLITGKMGSGKSFASAYLVEAHGAARWSRTELMKKLAHALADQSGDPDIVLARIFADREERDQVRRELLEFIARYQRESGKPRRLYQEVVAICQRHDSLCFETELATRMMLSPARFSIVDDVRTKASFEFFRERGFSTLRVNAPEPLRRARMLARDGALPSVETFRHYSELELDGVAHDFVIVNDGSLDDLHAALDCVVERLRARDYEPGTMIAIGAELTASSAPA